MSSMGNKGHMSQEAHYAQGGEVLGRKADFMKAPDRFRQQGPDGKFAPQPPQQKTSDDWGKGEKPREGAVTAPPERMKKSLKPVMPRGC